MELAKAKTLPQKLKVLSGLRLKHFGVTPALKLALTDPSCGLGMGQTAEVLAKEFGISRREQDEFALKSNLNAVSARPKLREEIVPVFIPPKYKEVAEDDNGPREACHSPVLHPHHHQSACLIV